MPGIRITRLTKTYAPAGAPPVRALDHIDLAIRPGEFVIVVGHNGSGKSTLLNVIAGVLPFDSGAITLFETTAEGRESTLSSSASQSIAALRQNPSDNVVVDLTVAENLALARLSSRTPSVFRRPRAVVEKSVFDELSLGETKAQAKARDLSGGQKQLLALQLALERGPRILLLDEPTASLDRENAQRVLSAVQRIWERGGITILLVTHDLPTALSLGTRLIVMTDARVVKDMTSTSRAQLTLEQLSRYCGFGGDLARI